MLTKAERDKIRQRANAAAEGPWFTGDANEAGLTAVEDGRSSGLFTIFAEWFEANFIAHARTDIPALLKTCDELEDQVAILMAKAVDFELKIIALIEGLEAEIKRLKAEAK